MHQMRAIRPDGIGSMQSFSIEGGGFSVNCGIWVFGSGVKKKTVPLMSYRVDCYIFHVLVIAFHHLVPANSGSPVLVEAEPPTAAKLEAAKKQGKGGYKRGPGAKDREEESSEHVSELTKVCGTCTAFDDVNIYNM